MCFAGVTGMPLEVEICHCGMVSHYLELKIGGAGLLCYAITADCIAEGKGDVRRMKCSHTQECCQPLSPHMWMCVVSFFFFFPPNYFFLHNL